LNVIDESDSQNEKQFDPRIWTLRRTQIDSSDDSENVLYSIRVNCEFDSNTMDWSFQCPFRRTI
jgi:hypothetical protein